ncbi:MAG: hypothetical protein Ct9H300mP3_03940 [Gammaproteobacteria bacterium]|nr:MAG: hypothetical protein Ct9H300mP3_03940 [Gammaproteobacteria bacterium]
MPTPGVAYLAKSTNQAGLVISAHIIDLVIMALKFFY